MSCDRSDMALFALFMVMVSTVASIIGQAAFSASEKAAAFRSYTDCLHAMQGQPIDVIQSFCGKIKDQL